MPKEEAAMCSPTSALVWDRGAFAPLGGRSQSTGIQPVLCRFEKEVLKDREHLSFRSKALRFPNLKFFSGHAPRVPPALLPCAGAFGSWGATV